MCTSNWRASTWVWASLDATLDALTTAPLAFTGGLGQIVMAWVHRYFEASRSSLYLLSMNIVAILAAWIIHGEPLTAVQILGGVVVFAAVAAVVSRPPVRRES